MINPDLEIMARKLNDLPVCKLDDICEAIVGTEEPDFVRKSDVLDILNQYVKSVYDREMLNLQLDLTQANLSAMLNEQNWNMAREWRSYIVT